MRFVNVTDETYEKLVKIAKETEQPVSKIVDDVIDGFMHFAVLSFAQNEALELVKTILDDAEEEGEELE
jgi:predicted CopG family antitoxin